MRLPRVHRCSSMADFGVHRRRASSLSPICAWQGTQRANRPRMSSAEKRAKAVHSRLSTRFRGLTDTPAWRIFGAHRRRNHLTEVNAFFCADGVQDYLRECRTSNFVTDPRARARHAEKLAITHPDFAAQNLPDRPRGSANQPQKQFVQLLSRDRRRSLRGHSPGQRIST